MSQAASLDGGRELEMVRQSHPMLGALVSKLIAAINRVATNAGVAAMGELPAPNPVNSTTVQGNYDPTTNTLTAPGEILHFVHTHNTELHRGIKYMTEIDTDPNFSNPHQIDTGSSRSGFVNLPGNNGQGYYMRVTPQLPGSAPQKPTVYGGLQGATRIILNNGVGGTVMDLLASQGAGTARPGQGGQGLGAVQTRPAVGGPKRDLTQQR